MMKPELIILGVAIYVHDSFSFTRLDGDTFKQNSTVYESMFLEIYNNGANFNKFIIGSELVDDLTQFIEEFSITLSNIHAISKQTYIIIIITFFIRNFALIGVDFDSTTMKTYLN